MYTLRLTLHEMFIRNDGLCTNNKNAARLFETLDQARDYVVEWRATSGVNGKDTLELNIVEVETKPVIQRVGKVVDTL